MEAAVVVHCQTVDESYQDSHPALLRCLSWVWWRGQFVSHLLSLKVLIALINFGHIRSSPDEPLNVTEFWSLPDFQGMLWTGASTVARRFYILRIKNIKGLLIFPQIHKCFHNADKLFPNLPLTSYKILKRGKRVHDGIISHYLYNPLFFMFGSLFSVQVWVIYLRKEVKTLLYGRKN